MTPKRTENDGTRNAQWDRLATLADEVRFQVWILLDNEPEVTAEIAGAIASACEHTFQTLYHAALMSPDPDALGSSPSRTLYDGPISGRPEIGPDGE